MHRACAGLDPPYVPSALCLAVRAESHSFEASTFSSQNAAKQRAKQSGAVSATHGHFRIIMDRDNPLAWACLQEAVFSSKTFRFRIVSKAAQVPGRDRALPGQRDPQRPPREALLRAIFLIASEEEKRGCLAKRIGNICLISGQTKAHPFRKAELPGAEIRPPRKRRTWHCIPCQHTNTGADSHGKTFLKNFKNGLDL